MRKLLPLITILILLTILTLRATYADELEEITKKLEELSRAREMSIAATKPLEGTLKKLEQELAGIRQRVGAIEADLVRKEKAIREGEEKLAEQQGILEKRVRHFYIRSYLNSPLLVFFSQTKAADLTREIAYQQAVTSEDKRVITQIVLQIKDWENKKASLQSERVRLSQVKEEIDKQAAFFRQEIKGAKEYQAKLSGEIAVLSARQQALLAEKLAGLNLPATLGAGPLYCTDDRKIDPGFRPAFAFFTFGIPHRVGMNQYGAYGRALSGQSYQDILQAYFQGISFEKKENMRIKVQGFGEMSLEEYLLGIYEMPVNWPIEAQKAQAVAARSYALAYTEGGAKEICTTQACQVYKGGNKGGRWEEAVRATEGVVMTFGGQVITAWYASTAGGYTFLSSDVGWSPRPWTKRMRDTKGDIASFSDLWESAYDRDSPCFYAAQGWRNEYGKSAWLKGEEVADIVNVLLLGKADSSTQKHLSQVDKPNPDGVETWSADKIKQELQARGLKPYNQISDISVDWDRGLGRTTRVNIAGDGGSTSFEGSEFKNFFNLRTPANIQIVGPLFNIEKK